MKNIAYLSAADFSDLLASTDTYTDIAARVPDAFADSFMLTMSQDEMSSDPDGIAVMLVRVLIEKGGPRKYIMTMKFQGFGDLVMIDIVSLDQAYHKDIGAAYLKMWGVDFSTKEPMYEVPVMLAGGWTSPDGETVKLESESMDFGNRLLGKDINEIGNYLLSFTEKDNPDVDTTPGENTIREILEFVLAHKRQPDFYEKLVDQLYANGEGKISHQHLSGLLHMKVEDRVAAGDGDYLTILVQEVAGGTPRYAMMQSVARRLRTTSST